ncbi:HlyD family secretion protein, partial [Rhizobium ruizarguesonis]
VIDDEALSGLLRSGMSVEPEIDTKAAQSQAAETKAAQAPGTVEEVLSSHAG